MTKGTQPVGFLYLREEATNIHRMDRNPHDAVRYRATIAANSLKVAASRTIADLLLQGVNAHDWRTELLEKNVLQIPKPRNSLAVGPTAPCPS